MPLWKEKNIDSECTYTKKNCRAHSKISMRHIDSWFVHLVYFLRKKPAVLYLFSCNRLHSWSIYLVRKAEAESSYMLLQITWSGCKAHTCAAWLATIAGINCLDKGYPWLGIDWWGQVIYQDRWVKKLPRSVSIDMSECPAGFLNVPRLVCETGPTGAPATSSVIRNGSM
jgi:hypothetical protein